jgi:hypothetical protein
METEAWSRGLAGWVRERALGDGVSGCRIAAAKVPGAYTRMTAHSVSAIAQRSSARCAFLISSRQLLEIELTSSQQTRKLFLISSFFAVLALEGFGARGHRGLLNYGLRNYGTRTARL